MGGHSKKSGRGGGGSQQHRLGGEKKKKKLTKDPGVPDLRVVSRKLTHTAQQRTHSVLSIPHLHNAGEEDAANAEGVPSGTLFSSLALKRTGGMGGGKAVVAGSGLTRLVSKKVMEQQNRSQHGLTSSSASPFSGQGEDASVSEAEVMAARRREMASFAVRTSERVHDYEAPMRLYAQSGGNGEDDDEFMNVDDVDRRGVDQSLRRFYKEFQRVVDNCDVLLQVLDARDPLGCRLTQLEQQIRSRYGEERKSIVVVLNKADLLPSKEVLDAWIAYFEHREGIMCIPFAATAKGSARQSYIHNLFRRLRALARNEETGDRKAIVVGVIGYPNVGKSSIINALKRKNVVGVGNMPGFTTGNTEVELRSDIRVMDCPGVVSPGEDNGDIVLRNAVKVSDLANPFLPVQRLLQRCTAVATGDGVYQPNVNAGDNEEENQADPHEQTAETLRRELRGVHPLALFYNIGYFPSDNVMEFIRLVGLRRGRLTKGGQVDDEGTARMILQDWNDGRIPYYTFPPEEDAFFQGDQFISGSAADGAAAESSLLNGGTGAEVVSGMARGLTLDGLPTFHLNLDRLHGGIHTSTGHGRRKKQWLAHAEENEEVYNDDDDDDDDDDDYEDEDA